MSERSILISRLSSNVEYRASYIKSKLGVLVPSQIRALRLRSEMPRQADLAKAAVMHQSRISMFETPGAANTTLETLARLAAAFKVGLVVKFVPFSEMLRWENDYSQDSFRVTCLEDDSAFVNPYADAQQLAGANVVGSLALSGTATTFQDAVGAGGAIISFADVISSSSAAAGSMV